MNVSSTVPFILVQSANVSPTVPSILVQSANVCPAMPFILVKAVNVCSAMPLFVVDNFGQTVVLLRMFLLTAQSDAVKSR